MPTMTSCHPRSENRGPETEGFDLSAMAIGLLLSASYPPQWLICSLGGSPRARPNYRMKLTSSAVGLRAG
jgi:hypothetical protein